MDAAQIIHEHHVKLGKKGGKARVAKMTAKQLSDAGRHAAYSRHRRLTAAQRSEIGKKAWRTKVRNIAARRKNQPELFQEAASA